MSLGLPLYMVSGSDLLVEIAKLDNQIDAMKKELSYRGGNGNNFKYGFRGRDGEIHGDETLSRAVTMAVEHFDDFEARFKVTKVYCPNSELVAG